MASVSKKRNIESPLTKTKRKIESPLTNTSIEHAFGQEVHMFLHIHLRGYDRSGEGKQLDSAYYDKYGAPVTAENSWLEGYHAVEKRLAKHFNVCINNTIEFPLVAGMSGGSHLYKPVGHDVEPWNWTGWVPQQTTWIYGGKYIQNRHFLALRGNEIQNNLWDYHPEEEEQDADAEDEDYEQISPTDAYKGGYFYANNPFARYLHIISLKSCLPSANTTCCKRYNYIVHPLAYRDSLNSLPDCTVDGIQWNMVNIPYEKNFGNKEKWGDRVHGAEIFNDFTYFYSYQSNGTVDIHNGEVMNYHVTGLKKIPYIYWFHTYPFEFCTFLFETAFTYGTYLHIIAANDAFYDRATLPPTGRRNVGLALLEKHEELLSDPKGKILRNRAVPLQNAALFSKKTRLWQKLGKTNAAYKESAQFLESRPYKEDTAFGYTTLIDTRQKLKDAVYESGDLNLGEMVTFDFLTEGQFFSHTGVYNLFTYDRTDDDGGNQIIPYIIQNQPITDKLCYEFTADMEMVFNFAKCQKGSVDLIWKYTAMSLTKENTLKATHGYFKLDEHKETKLDLSKKHNKKKLVWLYFTVLKHDNPQRRAWFSPIKGMAFETFKLGKIQLYPAALPSLRNEIASTEDSVLKVPSLHTEYIEQGALVEALSCKSGELDFTFDKCSLEEENNIYAYFFQGHSHQQDLTLEETKASSKDLPPRFLQNVHGYFRLNEDFPTRLNLSSSWDKDTVKDGKVYFYAIDVKMGKPVPIHPIPVLYSEDFEHRF